MFHQGHKELLQMMKRNGKVVVFLHNDKSTYMNKDKFPIQSFYRRRSNLYSTGLVSDIVEVRSPDPSNYLISYIKQSEDDIVYYRGDDWMDFPGKDALEKLGVKIVFKEYTKGISSTKLREEL